MGAAKSKSGLAHGADIAIAPDDPKLDQAIADVTDGYGCDVYLDVSVQTAAL
ncbi:MAG: hypothetical protein P8M25_04635 [Paracoccaceae bacterium]|nr:hypothetical protein [Paracoccaceae bacterium]